MHVVKVKPYTTTSFVPIICIVKIIHACFVFNFLFYLKHLSCPKSPVVLSNIPFCPLQENTAQTVFFFNLANPTRKLYEPLFCFGHYFCKPRLLLDSSFRNIHLSKALYQSLQFQGYCWSRSKKGSKRATVSQKHYQLRWNVYRLLVWYYKDWKVFALPEN